MVRMARYHGPQHCYEPTEVVQCRSNDAPNLIIAQKVRDAVEAQARVREGKKKRKGKRR